MAENESEQVPEGEISTIEAQSQTSVEALTDGTLIPSDFKPDDAARKQALDAEGVETLVDTVSQAKSGDFNESKKSSISSKFKNYDEEGLNEQVMGEEEGEEEGEEGDEDLESLRFDMMPFEENFSLYEAIDGEVEPEEEKTINYQEILDAPRFLPEPIELTIEYLKKIEKELGIIKLCWPKVEKPYFEERIQFPQSYLENSDKEKLLLLYTENFRRQFSYKFPHRKHILLAAENECGMQKMVCTTLRPTKLPHPEIETWKDCAKFVGNQLHYEQLDIPTVIPNRLCSPHTTFQRQSGQSYELATALCSLLLGMGYDAYVVSGYATRDITLRIMIRFDSPYPPQEEEIEVDEEELPPKKYTLKPPRDLRSKFIMMMEQRELDKIKAKEEEQKKEEARQIEEEEKPPFDELQGVRVHAWILIRPSREIEENMFVEPNTGYEHPANSSLYCGIESIWNHENYWVNMQNCEDGLDVIDYDLSNIEKWEHLLIGEPIRERRSNVTMDMEEEERLLIQTMEEKHLDMPPSWSSKISIPHNVLKAKFPGGQCKTNYKKTIVHEFAPYLQFDGLVRKICRYEDFDCTELQKYEEYFENRTDKLVKRILDNNTNATTEYFDKGRDDCVIKHYFCGEDRIIQFDSKYRNDCLLKLEIHPNRMIEYYKDREDFLRQRECFYMGIESQEESQKNTTPKHQQNKPKNTKSRKEITKIIEYFDRNEELPANNDVAVREFRLSDREIHLKYYHGKNKVTASTRMFIKPSLTDVTKEMNFTPEMTYGYIAELGANPPKLFQLFRLLQELLKVEENSLNRIRQIEEILNEFLKLRLQETAKPKLDVSIFNREQNEDYRIAMLEKEKELLESKEKEVEENIDYLAPYLAWIGNPTYLTEADANIVKQRCLQDFKQLLIDRANRLQKQFDTTSEELQSNYSWFAQKQDQLTPEEEMRYFKKVAELNFILQALEIRLHRHKELSSERYAAMVNYLDKHQKLIPENLIE